MTPRGDLGSRAEGQLTSPKSHLRLVLMVALTFFMFFGPFYRQVMKGHNEIFPRWVMYSGAGLEVVRVEIFVEDTGGDRKRLEQFQSSGSSRNLIRGIDELDDAIRSLMNEHSGQAALIVTAKIATTRGWEMVYRERRIDLEQP